MKDPVKRVLRSVDRLPFSPQEKKQVKKVFLEGASETGVLSPDDAKRFGK
jgi:hypothetical protein